jgi:hypothetical protein
MAARDHHEDSSQEQHGPAPAGTGASPGTGNQGDVGRDEEDGPREDRGAIREDLMTEESLMKAIQELEREADALEETRARRKALFGHEES